MVKVGRKALLRLLFGSDDVSIVVSCTPHRQGTVPDGCGLVAYVTAEIRYDWRDNTMAWGLCAGNIILCSYELMPSLAYTYVAGTSN